MDKPFLNYNEQVTHINDDKRIQCIDDMDKIILRRNGYFNLINGYKKPFVSNIDENGNHTYYPNTTIKHFDLVKKFDEELRSTILKYITKSEEEIRTFVGYKFDEISDGKNMWDDVNSYDTNQYTTEDIQNMIDKAKEEINKSELEYVAFYNTNHDFIPTWIFVKVINFSTFISFLKYSKLELKDAICKLYNMYEKNGDYNHKLLIGSLHWLRKVRNSCAHNERIFMMKRPNGRIIENYIRTDLRKVYSRKRDQQIFDLLIYLKYYLDENDYIKLIFIIKDLLVNISNNLSENVFANIRGSMGIKIIDDLDDLLKNKNIKYYCIWYFKSVGYWPSKM